MAPKPSKTTAAWWLVSNLTDVPVAMKCQINNQFKPDNPQHKPGSPWENWSLPTTWQLHLFCTTWSLFSLDIGNWQQIVSKLWFLRRRFCCGDVGPNGPNNKLILEEHLWHVASTTPSLATSLRVARLGWLPSQAKLPLHDGSCPTWQMCQWPWNVKSTISLSQIILNTNLDHLGKTGRYLQLHSFTFFALHDLYLV